MEISGRWIEQVQRIMAMKELILDMDSSASPTYGDQEGGRRDRRQRPHADAD